MIMKTKFLKIRLIAQSKKNFNLKKINEDLKSDTKSHLKIIETLSEGNPIDAPWQTTLSKRINKSNRTIVPRCKINNKNPNVISLHYPQEIRLC